MRRDLSLVCESVLSWSAARLGGEPLGGRCGEGIVEGRLHNVGVLIVNSCA